MSRFSLLLLFLILWVCVNGQQLPVQVFSPNAASLGQYGQVPVNYFNGLPEITIPLTVFKAKGYDLPVSISYHASGHRPDEHPGWVGLGWTLRAGGMINRIVNGYKDEKSEQEFQFLSNVSYEGNQSAYFYQADAFQNSDWSSEDMLRSIDRYSFSGRDLGTEPDEFQVNIDDIQASFYIVGDNKIKIKSKNPANFKVNIILKTGYNSLILYKATHEYTDLKSELFTYISEIVITKDDGTQYYFGGDLNAIEFSCIQHPQYQSTGIDYINSGEWKSTATANTWMLNKIKLTNGESIHFEYEKKGVPIIVSDCHSAEIFTLKGTNYLQNVINTKLYPNQYQNFSFSFIQPSYLKSIRSTVTRNEILFHKSRTTELAYNIPKNAFDFRVVRLPESNGMNDYNWSFGKLMAQNFYMQLDEIEEKNKRTRFAYSNDSLRRLRLLSIATVDRNGKEVGSYQMSYNTLNLPPYNSKLLDNWGYFNNRYYGDTDFQKMASFRIPDENYMQAEMLTGINYPTGGRSELIYEAHRYSQIAKQFDFKLMAGSGIAGGLRIKEIKNIENGKFVSRTFEYTDSLGRSSGILSGNHLYYVSGRQHVKYRYSRWWGLVHMGTNVDYEADYYIMSEHNINQLSITNGNHVTYSRIIENLPDGSKTVYTYSNHDKYMDETPVMMLDNIDNEVLTNAFVSKELERGLLLKTEYLNNEGIPVRTEINRYNSSPDRYNDFVKSANQVSHVGEHVRRVSALKFYTFYPYLESKSITEYDPISGNSLTTLEKYEYNAHKLPVRISRINSKGIEEEELVSYSGDLENATIDEMNKRYMVSIPIEKTFVRNHQVVHSELTSYRLNDLNRDYVPCKVYEAQLDNPIPYSSFVRYNGFEMDKCYGLPQVRYERYDSYSNVKEYVGKDYQPVSYLWDYKHEYPIAIVRNARNDYKVTSQYKDVRNHVNVRLNPNVSSHTQSFQFYTSRSGIVEINTSGVLGWNWFITGRLDNMNFALLSKRSRDEIGSPWTEYELAYKSKVEIAVPEGFHNLHIMSTKTYKGSDAIEEDASLQYVYWKRQEVNPSITGHNDYLYNNFENHVSDGYIPFGFHSSKSYVGKYVVELPTCSDRNYRIDYRVYKGKKWQYCSDNFLNGKYTIDEGIYPIDDIRVYPVDASIATYTYYPFIGLRSKNDGRGGTESYEYDCLGRLKAIKDTEDNPLKTYEYRYFSQKEESISTSIFYNEEQSMIFTRSNCDSLRGELGGSIEYVVPKAKYSSKISQEEANRIAYDDLINNGQRYADENADCVSHIIVSVYNPFHVAYQLEFVSGGQGNMVFDVYSVPPSQKIADTGDVLKDYLPSKLYIPRKNYRNVMIVNDGDFSEHVDLSIKSSQYNFNVFYTVDCFDGFEDTYVIGDYPFSY